MRAYQRRGRIRSRWNRPPCTTFQHPTSSLMSLLGDISYVVSCIRSHNCTLLRYRRNCQGTCDLLSVRRCITSNRAECQADCLRKRRAAKEDEASGRGSQQRAGQQDGANAESSPDNVLMGADNPSPRRRSCHPLESRAGELERDPCAAEAREDEHQDERERCRPLLRA